MGAEADQIKAIAEAQAASTRMAAEATADGLRAIAEAVSEEGGKDAMVQRLADKYVSELCCFTWSNMPMAVATTPEMSFGLSGTITRLLCLAISASSETYLSASRWTIASLPPSSDTASAMARKPSPC